MDCLPTPLEESPPGRWHCPICPPINPEELFHEQHAQEMAYEIHRETSIASTSKSPNYSSKSHEVQGKSGEQDVNGNGPDSPIAVKMGRQRSVKKGKTRRIAEDHEEQRHSPIRQTKRMRVRISSSTLLPRIRLRLPAQKGKGRERDEDEEHRKGIFDDILSLEDRDTAKTSVESSDKQRYERSRVAADVNELSAVSA